jgi:glycosyltransferase involved in cell wall biosynthesis
VKLLVLCERVDAEGGTESYLRALLPALVARGDDVRVLARSVRDARAYGVPCEPIAWSDEHDPSSPEASARVATFARTFSPDVAIAHNVLDAGVLAAARSNAPRFVYHLHDHRPFCPNGDRLYPQGGGICTAPMGVATCAFHALVHGCAYGPRPRTFGLIGIRADVALAIVGADAVISLSQYMRETAERNGILAANQFVIAPPLESEAFVDSPRARPAVDSVLFAGRVMASKGARSLVRALSLIEESRKPVLRIAGTGPDLDATIGEAEHHGVRVEALGRLSAVALRSAYDVATMVAVPSLWAEPYGLVGIEAFARGRPVVAYDAGGIPEWTSASAGGGIAVPRENEAALARAIVSLLDDARWKTASARAFAASAAFTLGPHVDALRAIYRGSPLP